MPFEQLTKILQSSISPVALISGIGLLLLAMTNRYARTTDGARALARQYKESLPEHRANLAIQIKILFERSKLLRLSIIFAAISIFCASLLILLIFVSYFLDIDLHHVILAVFAISFIALIISLSFFIKDLTLSLNALKQELTDFI
ncbi:DUF2721 domain-containing protein [bacterium]|nr:DUF2721 domain-containing protein [bacterium]